MTSKAKYSFATPRSKSYSNFMKCSTRIIMSSLASKGKISSTTKDSLEGAITHLWYFSYSNRVDGGGICTQAHSSMKMGRWSNLLRLQSSWGKTSKNTTSSLPSGRRWCTLTSWETSRYKTQMESKTPRLRLPRLYQVIPMAIGPQVQRYCNRMWISQMNGGYMQRWNVTTIWRTNMLSLSIWASTINQLEETLSMFSHFHSISRKEVTIQLSSSLCKCLKSMKRWLNSRKANRKLIQKAAR